jgi:hypothetical protein
MQNNLIQAITAYTTTLEQKMSALEARVAELERANEAMKQESDEAKALVATLQAEVAALATATVVAQVSEPEVEIELIVDEECLVQPPQEENEEQLESAEEPIEEPQEEVETPTSLEIPTADISATEDKKIEEVPTDEESVVVPEIEFVIEPIVEAKVKQPASRPAPQQTSLFGTAVQDIRQAVSLGDRFLFQRELFGDNGELMQKTFDEINGLDSLSEAMDYVQEHFDWNPESPAAQLFENVLRRRFS